MSPDASDIEQKISDLSDEESSELLKQIQLVINDSQNDLADKIVLGVVDEMKESFSELSIKSRPIKEVLDEFREMKLMEVSSRDQYKRKLDYLETFFEAVAQMETTDELTSEDVKRYRRWRKYESLSGEQELADTTLRDDMYLFREFIQYLIENRMAPVRFEKAVEIPEVDYRNGQGVDEKKLEPELANAALDYLRKYEYADVEHVAMELMCQIGPRKSGLVGRDLSDFDYDKSLLLFETRQTTPLKNDESSEREITLYGNLPDIVQDYIENKRPPETDEVGREPLLTKGDGRISKSMLQKIAYKWTRPCMVGLDCPHNRDPDECEAAEKNNAAFKCPSSRAPHHIRTGYITDQKNRGVSSDAIQQRCDVSPRVQHQHYDLPDSSEERERYEDEFKNADEDPDSGFSHQ